MLIVIEDERARSKRQPFSQWASSELGAIDLCDNNIPKRSVSTTPVQPTVTLVPPSSTLQKFLDTIEERTVLELTNSIPK
jgi:hypothetical protein